MKLVFNIHTTSSVNNVRHILNSTYEIIQHHIHTIFSYKVIKNKCYKDKKKTTKYVKKKKRSISDNRGIKQLRKLERN